MWATTSQARRYATLIDLRHCYLLASVTQPAYLLDRERDQNIEATAQSVIEGGRVISRLVSQSDKGTVETEAVILLLDAAARSGAIRDGIDPQDVLLAVAASTWSFAGDKDWKERAWRVLRLVMDGLRYRPR